jgi:hypothetical protein
MNNENFREGLRLARRLAYLGGVLGVLAGIWGIVRANGAEAVALEIGPLALGLAALMPAAVAYVIISELSGPDRGRYRDFRGAMTRMLTAALVGSVGAVLLFVVATVIVPAITSGEDAAELLFALGQLVQIPALITVLITVLAALTFTRWSHQAVSRKRRIADTNDSDPAA